MPANLLPPERYRAGNGVAITRHTDAKLPPGAKRRMVPRKHCMDVQRKPGLLEVCVLAAIRDQDSYGYQIIKDMKPYVELSESTLYPILRRLETAELLTVRSAEHNGRLRKYYHITQQGRDKIDAFQEDWKEILSIYKFITREETERE